MELIDILDAITAKVIYSLIVINIVFIGLYRLVVENNI
jgi:hypothetical protein